MSSPALAPRRGRPETTGRLFHSAEYAIEAGGLATFMVSASVFAALLTRVPGPFLGRVLTGLAMGATAAAIVYSPWGRRSGAHLNPVITLVFTLLGKVRPRDAAMYVVAQFAGGIAGIAIASALLGSNLLSGVQYVATVPGPQGAAAAFAAEAAISFGLMWTVLIVSNRPQIARFTGLCAAALVALFIAFESPISGMSMNPARTFGSAFGGRIWTALWVYFTAPALGMLLAAVLYRVRRGRVLCAKLHHDSGRCIFRCGFKEHPNG